MANSGAMEGAAPARRRVEELKQELRRFMEEILDTDDANEENYEEAARAIADIKELRFGAAKESPRKKQKEPEKDVVEALQSAFTPGTEPKVPAQFLCPLSSSIMRDPVVLSSGQTFERGYIQEWLRNGNRTCPKSDQVLSNTNLIPNHLLRHIISEWCEDHGVILEPPQSNPDTDCIISAADYSTFSTIVSDLSSNEVARKQAVKSLRHLTKRGHSFRALAGSDPTAIPQLLSILSTVGDDHELREDAVTALLNLSIHDFNKRTLGESEAIVLLIESMKLGGTPNTSANAAAALFALSALDSNKAKIGESGAIPPLVNLIEMGDSAAKKDAGAAVFSLCVLKQNRTLAVRAGAVGACLAAMSADETTVGDELLSLVALLSNDQDAAAEVAEEGGVPLLLKILREERNAKNVENAAAVLYAVCSVVRRTLREVGEEEARQGTISCVASSGTSRAMRKAVGILDKLNRIHCSQFSR
ncbi:hypothetical protein HPP92_027901 [Vanilla planifolia]|uniref:RING-type E3 ubiquitin transferase n=1 Tax=Vanilla planifolia TaxID=51239 RepID=A0A835P835_VANPL|nr:hypothetical protein HPP92_027901 [Vanilla planifolia]KAG0448409.1 hypothetical protein HPP92_027852 [Vanilla planifolia]